MLTGWATVNRLCCIPCCWCWGPGRSASARRPRHPVSHQLNPTAAASYVMTRARGGDSAWPPNIIATTTLGLARHHQPGGRAPDEPPGLMG